MTTPATVALVWLAGALAFALWGRINKWPGVGAALAASGLPDTTTSRYVALATVASIWFAVPIVALFDKGEK